MADTDCCAIPGECPQAFAEVCAPFESTGMMECFLSCEDDAVTASGLADSTTFCQKYANAAFICRSTGGGSKNRKVCVPDGWTGRDRLAVYVLVMDVGRVLVVVL